MRLRLAHSDLSAESYNIVKQPFTTTVDARGPAKLYDSLKQLSTNQTSFTIDLQNCNKALTWTTTKYKDSDKNNPKSIHHS